jgi:Uma2 family endonuclease
MAAAPVLERRVTIDDVRATPDGERYELVDGELVERHMSQGSSWVGSEIVRRIGNYAADTGSGYVFGADNRLDVFGRSDHFRTPDVSFTRAERMPGGPLTDGDQVIVPDLVVEVVSPNDTVRELRRKIMDYVDVGVRLTWVIYPDTAEADVYRADGTVTHVGPREALDGEDVIPGFSLPLVDIIPVQAGTG